MGSAGAERSIVVHARTAMSLHDLLQQLPPALRVAVVLAAAVLVGLGVHALLYRGFAHMGRRAPTLLVFDGVFLRRTRAPMRLLLPLLAVRAALPLLAPELEPQTMDAVQIALHVLLVGAVTWGLLALTRVLDDVVERRFDVDGTRYFWFHHTAADTPDKLDPREVAECVATFGVWSYVVADLPQRPPHSPPAAGR